MAPPRLSPHLSFKSAIVLLPPSPLTPSIEAIRRVHDSHFARWPPHINLIYPFLASPSETTDAQQGDMSQSLRRLKRDIYARIHKVIKYVQPFHISLNAEPAAGTFRHKKDSQTVWLKPSSDSVKELHAALQAEFSECTADDRPFTPHLSVGGAKSDEAAAHLRDDIRKSIIEFVSNDATETGEQARAILNWNVDKVFVIERRDFRDRFKVVGVVGLGEE